VPAGLIDLHCHILPGIDDGAVDLADSVAMARMAAADGVAKICATPHIRHDHDVRIAELSERLRELNAALRRESVPVEVVRGGEVAETSVDGLTDQELDAVTLGGGDRWLLVEPAPGPLSESLERTVAALAERGYSSLIAHPERHLTADLERCLGRLVRGGALIQATADAMVDERSAGAMAGLAARGLVHVVGSDSHSARYGRPPSLSRALAALRGIEPIAAHADWIATRAPAAIVQGEPLRPPYEPV
jgi:protein-tyrosine phosphatase